MAPLRMAQNLRRIAASILGAPRFLHSAEQYVLLVPKWQLQPWHLL